MPQEAPREVRGDAERDRPEQQAPQQLEEVVAARGGRWRWQVERRQCAPVTNLTRADAQEREQPHNRKEQQGDHQYDQGEEHREYVAAHV